MNKNLNIKFVYNCGDALQLDYGTEFGCYAKQITNEQMNLFIVEFNNNPWVYQHGYYLSIVHGHAGRLTTKLFNRFANMNASVKFLDHSAYIEATDNDWNNIEKHLFVALQKSWRQFLSQNVMEYMDHINKTLILANLDSVLTN